jgi:hypothetical protein
LPEKIKTRLTFANVASALALFFALGTAGAYAANTVFSTDIVNGEVKSVDIGNGAVAAVDLATDSVTTDEIAGETVRSSDVLNGSLSGADIDEGTLGPVPSATQATNSARLGGSPPSAFFRSANVRRIDWNAGCHVDPSNPYTCSTPTYHSPVLGGLTLHATCRGTTVYPGHVTADLRLDATGGANSETNLGYTQGTTAYTGGFYGPSGTLFDVYNGGNGSLGQVGTIIYRDPAGPRTVTISFFAFEYSTSGGDVSCSLYANELATSG